jgi:hypothetical protein
MRNLVPTGSAGSSAASYIVAAAAPEGTLLVAYVPPTHAGPFTIDMSVMAGATQAKWFNPTTGATTAIGEYANSGTQSFTVPGDNGSGFNDWVLLLQSP